MESSQQEAAGNSEPQQQPGDTTAEAEAVEAVKLSASKEEKQEMSSVVETAKPGDAMLEQQGPSGDASASRPLPLVSDIAAWR